MQRRVLITMLALGKLWRWLSGINAVMPCWSAARMPSQSHWGQQATASGYVSYDSVSTKVETTIKGIFFFKKRMQIELLCSFIATFLIQNTSGGCRVQRSLRCRGRVMPRLMGAYSGNSRRRAPWKTPPLMPWLKPPFYTLAGSLILICKTHGKRPILGLPGFLTWYLQFN